MRVEEELSSMRRRHIYWNRPVEVVYEMGGKNFVAFIKDVHNRANGSMYEALVSLTSGTIFDGMQKIMSSKDSLLAEGLYLLLDPVDRTATIKCVTGDYETYVANNEQYIAKLDTPSWKARHLTSEFSALKELVAGRLEEATYYVSGGVFRITDHDIEYTSSVCEENMESLPRRLYTFVDMLTETKWKSRPIVFAPVKGEEYLIVNTEDHTMRVGVYGKTPVLDKERLISLRHRMENILAGQEMNSMFSIAAGTGDYLGIANQVGDLLLWNLIKDTVCGENTSLRSSIEYGDGDSVLWKTLTMLARGEFLNRMQRVNCGDEVTFAPGKYLWVDNANRRADVCICEGKHTFDDTRYLLRIGNQGDFGCDVSYDLYTAVKNVAERVTHEPLADGEYFVGGGVFVIDGDTIRHTSTIEVTGKTVKDERVYMLLDKLTDCCWHDRVRRSGCDKDRNYLIVNMSKRTAKIGKQTEEGEYAVDVCCKPVEPSLWCNEESGLYRILVAMGYKGKDKCLVPVYDESFTIDPDKAIVKNPFQSKGCPTKSDAAYALIEKVIGKVDKCWAMGVSNGGILPYSAMVVDRTAREVWFLKAGDSVSKGALMMDMCEWRDSVDAFVGEIHKEVISDYVGEEIHDDISAEELCERVCARPRGIGQMIESCMVRDCSPGEYLFLDKPHGKAHVVLFKEQRTLFTLSPMYMQHLRDYKPDYSGYTILRDTLSEAADQAEFGKGKERHGCDLPFMEQEIMTGTKAAGIGFPIGQARKKLAESIVLLELRGKDAAIAEIKGAINYAAAAIIHLKS